MTRGYTLHTHCLMQWKPGASLFQISILLVIFFLSVSDNITVTNTTDLKWEDKWKKYIFKMLIIMSCISLWHISLTGFYQVLRQSFRFLLQHHTTFSGPSMAVCVCFKVVLFVLLNVTLFRISPQIHRKEKCRDLSRYDPPTHKHTHIKTKTKKQNKKDIILF